MTDDLVAPAPRNDKATEQQVSTALRAFIDHSRTK
jgi:hypothetical protein